MSEKKEIYQLEHVTKVFREGNNEVRAVDDVSFSIYEGEIFGIIGMSGAGKSTLVRTLNRLEEITDGTIRFDDVNLQELSAARLRKERQSIAMIFQNFNLMMQKTVLDNVMAPMRIAKKLSRQQQREKAKQMLEIVGLQEKAEAYPAQLSGGQRQRVAIARALAMDPRVLLCDEATSALDPKMTDEILTLLKDINRRLHLTIVIITHEMKVIEKICDRVAIIEHGKLAEIGAVEQIFTEPQSSAAKHLLLPFIQGDNPFDMTDKRCFRIVFDGRKATEPVIANLVKVTGEEVNILSANTRSVGGVGYGQMIVEIPEDPVKAEKVLDYLHSIDINLTEIEGKEESL